jgi:hypothetical protein
VAQASCPGGHVDSYFFQIAGIFSQEACCNNIDGGRIAGLLAEAALQLHRRHQALSNKLLTFLDFFYYLSHRQNLHSMKEQNAFVFVSKAAAHANDDIASWRGSLIF